MDYSNFLGMRDELSLLVVIVLLFLYDTFGSVKSLKCFSATACVLLLAHTIFTIVPGEQVSLFGGMYQSGPATSVIKTILNIGTLLVLIQASSWIKNEDVIIRRGEYYVLTLITLLGMYLMTSSGNFLLFFLGLETASLPITALVAMEKYKHDSHEAAAKYVFIAVFSSALMLLGISYLYGIGGTLYFDDLSYMLGVSPLLIVGLVFFIAGLGFKLSLVPFHLWTADVYEGAPSTVTAYLSVISKGSAAFVLMAILIKVFAPMIHDWQEVLYWVTIASITIANIFAIRQQNLKRLMAFSSISQAGYIMLGVIGGTAQGMTAMVYYILVYAAANLGVFAVITIVALRSQKFTLEDYAGLYKTNPKMAFLMTISLFSLAGIPPFAGFFSKFFIFMAAFEAGFHLLVFIALVNTVISLYYYLLIVKAMYITPSDNPIPTFRSDRCTKWGLALCTLGIIGLGIASIVYQSIDKLSFGI